jgi:hypothetical protein
VNILFQGIIVSLDTNDEADPIIAIKSLASNEAQTQEYQFSDMVEIFVSADQVLLLPNQITTDEMVIDDIATDEYQNGSSSSNLLFDEFSDLLQKKRQLLS